MKTTKTRLQELAAIKENKPTIKENKEAKYAHGNAELSVDFEGFNKWWESACEANGVTSAVNLEGTDKDYQSQVKDVQRLMETVREDLEIWLGNNGLQWLEDGIDSGNYDEFIQK